MTDPLLHAEVRASSTVAFAIGYVISVALMVAALVVTMRHALGRIDLVVVTSLLAMLTLITQAVFMFRLNLSQSDRWKAVSLVLALPLFVLMLGLTGWMFHTLYLRTMLPGTMGH